jgi:hypothetical protein
MTLQINVVCANDLPVGDVRTSDPFVNIYLQGPIKTLVGRTQTIEKTLNPKWNETFNVPAIRGLKILFEVYDYDAGSKDELIAFTTFDPNFQALEKVHKLPLTRAIFEKGENATITISVKLIAIPLPNTKIGTLTNPIYISFEPSTRLWSKSPFSTNAVLPFIFPYHLYFIAFNGSSNTYEVCSTDHKNIAGAWHSGANICLSSTSFTEVIRIDPSVLISNGYKTFLICIGTTDYSLLNNHFQTGDLLFWQSNEPSSTYIKAEDFEVTSPELQIVKLAEKIPFTPNNISSLGVIIGGTIDNSGKLNLNGDSQCLLPAENNLNVGQTVTESISILSKLSKIVTEELPNKATFPLYTPISLNRIGDNILQEPIETLTARIINVKEHYLFGLACEASKEKGEEIIGECNPKNINPNIKGNQDGIKYSGGAIQIDFNKIGEDVTSIYIGVTGEKPLKTDKPTKSITKPNFLNIGNKKKNQNQSIAQNGGLTGNEPMISISIQSKEINKIPLKLSGRNNSLIWFALIRDPLVSGSWSLFNISRGYKHDINFGSLDLFTQYVSSIKERLGI